MPIRGVLGTALEVSRNLDLNSDLVLWLRRESTLGVAGLEGPKFRGYTTQPPPHCTYRLHFVLGRQV